jgi:hypothetical protein
MVEKRITGIKDAEEYDPHLLDFVKAQMREDARMVAQGHPFKVIWWHHRNNGDDVPKMAYFSINPSNNLKVSQKNLRAYIKKTGSAMAKGILRIKRESRGDFKVVKLG